jgi:hypothetical protein
LRLAAGHLDPPPAAEDTVVISLPLRTRLERRHGLRLHRQHPAS